MAGFGLVALFGARWGGLVGAAAACRGLLCGGGAFKVAFAARVSRPPPPAGGVCSWGGQTPPPDDAVGLNVHPPPAEQSATALTNAWG